MKCPVCQSPDLVMTDRQGIEIDYCPQCRGVWLDRGELDKIIERSAAIAPGATPSRDRSPERERFSQYPEHRDDDDYRGPYRRKRREGFLGELFDFD